MHKLLLTSSIAGALALATIPASAMPGAQPLPLASSQPDVTLVSGGCGLFRHRGWNGFCYPGGGGFGFRYGWHRPFGGYGWHRWRGGWRGGWHRVWRRW